MSELDPLVPERFQRFRRLPVTRDQVMLLLAATGELALGGETYLAHSMSGTIVPRKWIPIVFGFVAGGTLLVAGVIALRHRTAATLLATVTLVLSIGVGLLGAYFHLVRAAVPGAVPGQRLTIDLLVWAPPVMGPLVFSLIGLLGVSAAWPEDRPDSGVLFLLGDRTLRLPYSKTRAYLLMVAVGILAALISSVLDHARTGFTSVWVWVPTIVAVFGVVSAVTLAALAHPTRADLATFVVAMALLLVIGPVGSVLHGQQNLVAGSTVVLERFLRGPPALAPLLYSNMGLLGLAVLVAPERASTRSAIAA